MMHKRKALLLLFVLALAFVVARENVSARLLMASVRDVASETAEIQGALGDYCCYNYLPIMIGEPLPPPPIYFDDFSDPASGWPIDDIGDYRWGYENGEYELWMANTSQWIGAVNLNWGASGNYSLEAETRRHIGDTTDTGIVFDWEDWENNYVFLIDPSSQLYAVFKKDNDIVSLVIPVGSSPAINSGNDVNRLRVEREGEVIRIYANDQFLATGNDAPFPDSLRFGFYGESDNSSPAALRYDNLVVFSPIQSLSLDTVDSGWTHDTGLAPAIFP